MAAAKAKREKAEWQAYLAAAEDAARCKKKAREEAAERERETRGGATAEEMERERERVQKEVRELAANDVEGNKRREKARAEDEAQQAALAAKVCAMYTCI